MKKKFLIFALIILAIMIVAYTLMVLSSKRCVQQCGLVAELCEPGVIGCPVTPCQEDCRFLDLPIPGDNSVYSVKIWPPNRFISGIILYPISLLLFR